MKLPKPSSCARMVHPCIWSQEGSGCPQVLSLLLGKDFERLTSTPGELDKGTEGPQYINGTYISICLLGDSDKALPVPYNLQNDTGVQISDQTVRNRLHSSELRSRRPFVGLILTPRCSPEGVCQGTPGLATSPLAPCAFHRWKSVQLKWIRRTRKVWRSTWECY